MAKKTGGSWIECHPKYLSYFQSDENWDYPYINSEGERCSFYVDTIDGKDKKNKQDIKKGD